MDSTSVTPPVLDDARRAYGGHEFQLAADLYRTASEQKPLGPDDLYQLAHARWFSGSVTDFGDLLERAYGGHIAAGDEAKAAIVALDLFRINAQKLNKTVAEAWMRRAAGLIEGKPESSAHGNMALYVSFGARMRGDLETALERAHFALEIGTRVGDRDVQALALNQKGRALIRLGRVAEGKALLDEGMVAAVGGELSAMVAGTVYCNTIDACTDLADYGRAGEWTEAARRWCARKSINGFPGLCRVHQAELMRLRGNWLEAESEAVKARRELEEYAVLSSAALAHYEIGEIRLRMGDLDGAEQAFRAVASAIGFDPQPGSALLRLARGKPAAAASAIRRALEDAQEPLTRVRFLPAAVRIFIAVGGDAIEEAARAAAEIEAIAATFDAEAFRAYAAAARGSLALARGEVGTAAPCLRAALKLWKEVDMPYEAAQARLLLAEAYRREGDEEEAQAEGEAARGAFERLGAERDAEQARGFLAIGAAQRSEAGAREALTFMFTDIVGSTNLLEAMGDEAWMTLLKWHDETLRSAFSRYGGEEIKHTGDGFLATFKTPAAAVGCAVAIQRQLDEHRRAQGFAPQVRIGIHATEATRSGSDFAGKGVHEAARISALAGAAEIVASMHTVRAGAGEPVLENRRSVTLKGIADSVEVVNIAWRHAQG